MGGVDSVGPLLAEEVAEDLRGDATSRLDLDLRGPRLGIEDQDRAGALGRICSAGSPAFTISPRSIVYVAGFLVIPSLKVIWEGSGYGEPGRALGGRQAAVGNGSLGRLLSGEFGAGRQRAGPAVGDEAVGATVIAVRTNRRAWGWDVRAEESAPSPPIAAPPTASPPMTMAAPITMCARGAARARSAPASMSQIRRRREMWPWSVSSS